LGHEEEDETGATRAAGGDGRQSSARAGDAPRDLAAPGERAAARAGPLGEPWLLVACLCVVAAAVCLILGYYDAAFVTAALGAVAWFLNVRSKLPPPPEDEEDDEPVPEEDDHAADSS
jgi:hypothetical protein